MGTSSQRIVSEVPQETIEKIDRIIHFVEKHEGDIKEKYQRWYNAKEAAKYLRVSLSHLMSNLKDEINYSRQGRTLVFERADLDAYWETRKMNKKK